MDRDCSLSAPDAAGAAVAPAAALAMRGKGEESFGVGTIVPLEYHRMKPACNMTASQADLVHAWVEDVVERSGVFRIVDANEGFDIQRKVRLVTDQNVMPDKPQQMEGFPMRKWSVSVYILDEDGEQHAAECFQRVTYNLHPSFENPTQTFTKAPFTCENEGWGEFEMTIDMYTTEKSKQTIPHDLNFQQNHYETEHTVSFKNPSQALQQILRETGPLPNDEDRKRKSGVAPKKSQKYDYEKLADGLARLEEDDLLRVIQMINDNRTDSMYIKSDTEAGEFSVDLFSMPDKLTKEMWDYLQKKGHIV